MSLGRNGLSHEPRCVSYGWCVVHGGWGPSIQAGVVGRTPTVTRVVLFGSSDNTTPLGRRTWNHNAQVQVRMSAHLVPQRLGREAYVQRHM